MKTPDAHFEYFVALAATSPPLVFVIDVAVMITGKSAKTVARDLGALSDRYPEVSQKLRDLKFPGRRQRDTPVTDAKAWGLVQMPRSVGLRMSLIKPCSPKGIAEIIMLLPGQQAARVRRQAAELLVKYFGEDLNLVEDVCRLRGFQRGSQERSRGLFLNPAHCCRRP